MGRSRGKAIKQQINKHNYAMKAKKTRKWQKDTPEMMDGGGQQKVGNTSNKTDKRKLERRPVFKEDTSGLLTIVMNLS